MAGFTMKTAQELLAERGLLPGGKVQTYIDNECKRLMDKYTPFRTGTLKRSVTGVGSGELHQNTPYARMQYYNNAGRGTQGTASGGLRGRLWFERMKAAHKKDILNGAAKLCGAKPKGG